MSKFNLESVYKSLIAEVQDIISQVRNGGLSDSLSYHAWDSRGSITELPDDDLLGLVNWTFAENEGLCVIETGLLLSTINDENLFKEVRILDVIRNHCVDTNGYKQWRLIDKDTAQFYGQITVADFEVLPSGRSEVRNTRHIGIQFLMTANYNGR